LAQPPALAFDLAGFPALRLGAVLLMPPVAQVRHEQLLAMQALTATTFRHTPRCPNRAEKSKASAFFKGASGKKTDRKKGRKALRETLPNKTDPEENGEP
jgi:hypothetical protein